MCSGQKAMTQVFPFPWVLRLSLSVTYHKFIIHWDFKKSTCLEVWGVTVWAVCPGLHSNSVVLIHEDAQMHMTWQAHNFLQSLLGNAGPFSVKSWLVTQQFSPISPIWKSDHHDTVSIAIDVSFNFLPSVTLFITQWTRSGSKEA